MQNAKSARELHGLEISAGSAGNNRVRVPSTVGDWIAPYSPDAVRAKASEVR
jgi:hypothetical protein